MYFSMAPVRVHNVSSCGGCQLTSRHEWQRRTSGLRRVPVGRSMLLAMIALLLPLEPAPAQSKQRIRGRASCANCRIELTTGVRLGDREGPGIIESEPSWITQDKTGQFLVTQYSSKSGAPILFAPTGTVVSEVGRRGSGPGEYRRAGYSAIARGDTILVSDMGNGRVNVYTPTMEFARAVTNPQLGGSTSFVVLSSGVIVANGDITTAASVGLPLHLYDANYRFVKSFGAEAATFLPDRRLATRRRLARSSDGGFWAAHVTRYVIEKYDSAGVKTIELEREADWFPPHDQGLLQGEDRSPKPLLLGISEDSVGRVWVLSVIGDAAWRSAIGTVLPSRLGGGRSPAPVITDFDKYFDAVLEVIDVKQRRVIASQRFPQALTFLVNDHIVAQRIETDGDFFIQTWRLGLLVSPQTREEQ